MKEFKLTEDEKDDIVNCVVMSVVIILRGWVFLMLVLP